MFKSPQLDTTLAMFVVTPRSSLNGISLTNPAASSAATPAGPDDAGVHATHAPVRRETYGTPAKVDGNPVLLTSDHTLLQMRQLLRHLGDTASRDAQRDTLQSQIHLLTLLQQQGHAVEQDLHPLVAQYGLQVEEARSTLDTLSLPAAAPMRGTAQTETGRTERPGGYFAPLRGMLEVLDEIEQRDTGGYLYKYYTVLAAQTEYLKLINELTKVFAEKDFAKRDGDNHLQVDINRVKAVYGEVLQQLSNWMKQPQNHGGFLNNASVANRPNGVGAVSDATFNGRLAFWEEELSGLGVRTERRAGGKVLFDFKSDESSELARIRDAFLSYKAGGNGRARLTTAEYQHLTRTVDNIRSDFERTLKRTQQRTDNTMSQARSVLDAITRAADDFTSALQAWLNRL